LKKRKIYLDWTIDCFSFCFNQTYIEVIDFPYCLFVEGKETYQILFYFCWGPLGQSYSYSIVHKGPSDTIISAFITLQIMLLDISNSFYDNEFWIDAVFYRLKSILTKWLFIFRGLTISPTAESIWAWTSSTESFSMLSIRKFRRVFNCSRKFKFTKLRINRRKVQCRKDCKAKWLF